MRFTPRILFNLQKDQNQVVDSLELANEVETRVTCDLDIGQQNQEEISQTMSDKILSTLLNPSSGLTDEEIEEIREID